MLTGVGPEQHRRPGGGLRAGARRAARSRDEDEAVRWPTTRPTGSPAPCGPRTCTAPTGSPARIRAGTVWINAYRVVAPGVPFGGFGASGIGRENGMAAVDEYTETKAVWVELTGRTRDPFVLG